MVRRNSAAIAAMIGAATITAPAIGMAQGQQDRGFYIGGSIGQMDAGGDCPSGRSCDFKDTAWKVFGGYKFNRHLAVEGTYGDWGEITESTTVSGVPVTVTGEIWSAGVAALGMLPLGGDRFSLFGKAGLLYTEQKVTGTAPGIITITETRDGTELHWGFGAMFNITGSLGLRAEWERLHDSEVDIMSIGIQYKF